MTLWICEMFGYSSVRSELMEQWLQATNGSELLKVFSSFIKLETCDDFTYVNKVSPDGTKLFRSVFVVCPETFVLFSLVGRLSFGNRSLSTLIGCSAKRISRRRNSWSS